MDAETSAQQTPGTMNEACSDPYEEYLHARKEEIRAFYEREAPVYAERWIPRNRYYYRELERLIQHLVPADRTVLDAGCGVGDMLAAARPSRGLGIDFSAAMVGEARLRHPDLEFRCLEIERAATLGESFDYVVSVNSVAEMADVRRCLSSLGQVMREDSRLVIVTYNFRWHPVLELGARLRLRPRNPDQSWLSAHDYRNLLEVSGFDLVTDGFRTMLPKYVPGIAELLNGFLVRMPLFRQIGVVYWMVARPRRQPPGAERLSVSVVVPCKDEEDNIDGLTARIPEMGAGTEIVFVDDESTDGTRAKIEAAICAHPERKIRLVDGPGRGKGAACRAGFAAATHDVFMILDADMTVMPEVLPDFLEVIAAGQAEFVNGSRSVYPMEHQAMRFANVVGNKMFALLFTFILGQPIKDTLCGTKVIRARDYPKLLEARERLASVDLWGDYDWLFGAALHHLKIVELPVHYVARSAGQTKMTRRLRNARVMLRMCVRAFLRIKLG